MIKKYFTDGLIGLAILLSLFRTDLDLVNLNNLINYPEVQDIIQGQTAAYLPSNFHHLPNTLYGYSNQKHLDVNSEAFTSWFNNLNIGISNIPHSQERRNDIEAFLVSGATIVNTRVQDIEPSTTSVPIENSVTPSVSSPTLPEEGAYSYPELSVLRATNNNTASQNVTDSSSPSASGSSTEQTPVVVDVSFLCNNPFPGCNLTLEDLQLIDVLWRQDEDLGVGKEVYDANLRLEMEKKQEVERIRLQEMQKEQRLAKEKEEREKHEQASKWLKENFRRDGETGEWVCVQNTTNAMNGDGSAACMSHSDSGNDEFPTLESALDYILNVDPDVLAGTCESVGSNQSANCQSNILSNPVGGFQVEEPVQQQNHQLQHREHQQQIPQQQPAEQAQAVAPVQHQDSLEDGWSGLVNYLNLTGDGIDAALNECCQNIGNNNNTNNINTENQNNNFTNSNCSDESNLLFNKNITDCQSFLLPEAVNTNSGTDMFAAGYEESRASHTVGPVSSDTGLTMVNSSGLDNGHSSILLNNASMPAENTNMTAELMTLASASEKVVEMGSANSSAPSLVTSQTSLQPFPSSGLNSLDLGNIGGFFEDLAGLDGAGVEDLNMDEIDNMLHTIQSAGPQLLEPIMNLGDNMDTLQKLGDELNQSMGNASSQEDYDALDELEGATGGYDDFETHNQLRNLKDASRHSRPKSSRFSESSSDSGYAYNKAGSPASSSFSNSSSNNGSYASSPSGSHHGSDDGLHHHSDHHQHHGNGKNLLHSAYNISTSNNGTEHDPNGSRTLAQHQVAHNHTYNTPPGQVPREVKKYAQKEPSRKGPHSRDQRRAADLKIPFTLDEIIDSPVETFNDMISSHKLNESQLSMIRDIRRRGKNKVAAQNCRKRKVNVIENLSDERSELEKTRDRLIAERAAMERETRRVRAKFGHLYASIFQSLRDEQGRPYDPNLYSLQQSSDGNVFLVPRNMTNSTALSLASVPFTVASPSSRDLSLPSASFLPLSPSTSNGGSSSHFLGMAGGSTGTSSAASSASSSPSATSTSPPSPVSTSKSRGGISASKKRKTFDE